MTKPVKPDGMVMISGELYVAFARSKPHEGRRHRLLVHKRNAPSETYWAVAQHNMDRGPWKIQREASIDEVELEIDLEAHRVMAMSPNELAAESVAHGSTPEADAAAFDRAVRKSMH